MDDRYTIEVGDDFVEIHGDLTIEEAFDYINFFEKKGFKSLRSGWENSTLLLCKNDVFEKQKEERKQEAADEERMYHDFFKSEKDEHDRTKEKLKDVERLLKQLMSEEYEKYKKLKEENDKLIKAQLHLFLHEDPRVQEMLKNGDFNIGCTPPGMEMGDKGPVPHPEMFGIDEGSCGVSKTN